MTENLQLGEQVLSLFFVDCILASLCGLLLADCWIARARSSSTGGATDTSVYRPSLRLPSLVLPLALCAQFWLSTMTMTGQSAPSAILRSMPDVAGTHAGRVLIYMLSLSVPLAVVGFFHLRGAPAIAQRVGSTALLAAIFLFHSALGHAASDGDFTRAELLQFLHLTAMALWTGGVFVSAFLALPGPHNASAPEYTAYLRRLSNSSAWSASTAILTGALKGWIAIGARIGNLAQPGWSRILLAKLLFVGVALGLGFLHRHSINDRKREWNTSQRRVLVGTLRVEAVCLALVLLLSAWLSNADPPD
jgi:putative copper export protein